MTYAKGSFFHEDSINTRLAQQNLDRRFFFKMLGAGAGAAALAGGGVATRGIRSAAAQEGIPGGTLRIGLNNEPDTLDPHRTPSRYMWMVGLAMYDPLVISDNTGAIFPNLASEWTISEDGLIYTFTLRQDVTFHDGTPFNAEAVKYNYDRVVAPETGSLLSNDDIGPYESSTVIDDYTVEIKMSAPYGPFLRMISLMEFAIISPTAAEEFGLDEYGRNPVGTGPFKFVEWTLQERTVFEKNADYAWGSPDIYPITGAPYLDGIEYIYLIEAGTRIAALESGEVDAITSVPQLEVARLEESGDYEVLKFPASGHPSAFIINTMKAPTDDVNVRTAINLALDRQAIVESLYDNQNTPAYGPLTPATFAYWPEWETRWAYNLEEADRLMTESGWTKGDEFYEKDGEPITLELYVFGEAGPTGEAAAGQLALSGFKVNVNVLEFSEQKGIAYEGLHNLCLVTFGAPDPRILKLLYHSINMRENGWAWTHFMEANPEQQGLLDAALDLGDTETDPAAREAAYFEAQRLIAENALVMPVKNDFQIIGLAPKVENWQMDDANFHPRPYPVFFSEG